MPRPALETLRLFIALWPDTHTRQALSALQAKQNWPLSARPTAAPDLHVTLHFLGQLPQYQLAPLLTALPAVPLSLDLCFDHLEVWPNQVATLTLSVVPDALIQLHETIGDSLRQIELQPDPRPYRPHVTLARKAQGLQAVMPRPLDWRSQGYVLALSDRGYHVLQHYG